MRIYILLIAFTFSCNTLDGHRGISGSLEESKQLNVFKNLIDIQDNDIHELKNIKNAWIENSWNYNRKKAKVRNGYETIIISFNEKVEGYGTKWEIVESNNNWGKSLWEISGDSTILFKEGNKYSKNDAEIKIIYKSQKNFEHKISYSIIDPVK